MIRRHILLALCVTLSCIGHAQTKTAQGYTQIKKETTSSEQQKSTNRPPMNSAIVKELKKIDYAEITHDNILIPNCATELDDDGTVPVDEAEYAFVKGVIAKDVIAANSLEEELNTPLKKKHYMESEEYKTDYESLLAQRTCILDHEYFIESDFNSQFDLNSHTFSFNFHNPNCFYLNFSTNDAQCSMEGTKFTTTPLSEDLAYQIETNQVKTYVVVKLGEKLYHNDYLELIPQRIYLASLKDGEILYKYEFTQRASANTTDSLIQKEDVTTEDANKIYNVVDEMPKHPDGDVGVLRSIAQNLKYPVKAIQEGTQGIVVVKFVVEKDGSIGDTEIYKSLSPECDEAAINAIKKIGRFIPGKQNGVPVRVWINLPIRFRF